MGVSAAYDATNKIIMRSLSSARFAACAATSGSPDAASDAPKEIKNVAANKENKKKYKIEARQGGTLIKRPKYGQ